MTNVVPTFEWPSGPSMLTPAEIALYLQPSVRPAGRSEPSPLLAGALPPASGAPYLTEAEIGLFSRPRDARRDQEEPARRARGVVARGASATRARIPSSSPRMCLVAAPPSPDAVRAAAGIFARGLVARAWAEIVGSEGDLTSSEDCGLMPPDVEKASPPTVGAVDED